KERGGWGGALGPERSRAMAGLKRSVKRPVPIFGPYELRTYIVNNAHLIPNYGERYRNGEAIATGFVESTVNQVVSKRFCKKQQMQWTKRGAHLLLQTRVKTLNGELGEVFKRWYPDMQVEELAEVA